MRVAVAFARSYTSVIEPLEFKNGLPALPNADYAEAASYQAEQRAGSFISDAAELP
jgi:hypothetical protein